MKRFWEEEVAQASLEYLFMTAFVLGLAAITAMLLKNVSAIQDSIRAKLQTYRNQILNKLAR